MYGLLIPVGVDARSVELLERFAEEMVMVVAGAYAEHRRPESDLPMSAPEPTGDEEDWAEDDVTQALQEFMRKEVGRGMVVGGAMTLDDRLMALADNGASKHRRVGPRQPKRYNTKVLQGPW